MLKVAVPNKGSLSDTASDILREAGYASRRDSKALTIIDRKNDVEFFFLRPKDIAIYVANGHLDLGITGRDLAADSLANVTEVLALGFGSSTFRYAAPTGWTIDQLNGARIATSYPNLVRTDLKKRGITADVIRLDGAVEISIKLGVADVIADVVSTGTTLRKQGLEPFGEPLCTSEAVIVGRADREVTPEQRVLLRRVEGILHAQNYLMLDYNVPRHLLDDATRAQRRADLAAAERVPALRLRADVTQWTVHDFFAGNYTGDVDDMVLRRGGQAPDWAYNLAVVVDDAFQGVDQVVRGRDLLSSAPRQAYLAGLLGIEAPDYVHVPLVLGPTGRRLAKRDGAVTLREMLHDATPGEVVSRLAVSLGFGPVSSAAELLEVFDPAVLSGEDYVWG